MLKAVLFAAIALAAELSFANSSNMQIQHTGYCRYGEECPIVSLDIDEARRICSKNTFEKEVIAVRQRQQDGSIKFIGYACYTPAFGG